MAARKQDLSDLESRLINGTLKKKIKQDNREDKPNPKFNPSFEAIIKASTRAHTDTEHYTLLAKLTLNGEENALWDISVGKKILLAEVVHDKPSCVIDFFLEESTHGKFRRHIIHEFNGEEKIHRLMYWQHYNGREYMEYLLVIKVRVSKGDSSGNSTTQTIELSSVIDEGERG